jgi:hypothetical protein
VIRLAADEDFNFDILRALLRRNPAIDVVRAQEAGLSGAEDSAVLAWAAAEGRILLSHDVSTMTRFAYDRVRRNEPMPGLFEVGHSLPVGAVADDLLLIAECSRDGEWEGQVRFLPLR